MDTRIQEIIAILNRDYHQSLSLQQLARGVGLSSSRLRHKFKTETGVTPTAYLGAIRMRSAEELLRSQSLSVKEVRAAIGLNSDSYFTHRFKRTFGVLPSHMKYR
ncbi:MAG TPA: AraC family transcriptional regulator [Pyrinomonadaceae bacterium]|nr:AraC family transcriptional regulator [Pyrinomonadaceae bacterium]